MLLSINKVALCFQQIQPQLVVLGSRLIQRPDCTCLFAGGFGNPSKGSSSRKGFEPKNKGSTSIKKKLQIKQRILEDYGGDVAKGTEQRVQSFMSALPPEVKEIVDLYKKVRLWDASMSSLSIMQQANIPQRDIEGAKRARAQLETLLQEQALTENDIHNIFQKITWDASADAKAMNAKLGKMPEIIEERVNRACRIIAESVRKKSRKDGRCLDVGCGHGTLVPNLLRAGIFPNQITGVDLSPEMIRNAKAMHRGVNFIDTDFLRFDPDQKFDAIIFCSALHDLPDVEQSLVKATSLLQPGGKLVLLHAQGAQNVDSQHRANPVLVKRLLPDRDELRVFADKMNLILELEPAEPGSDMDEQEGYLAVLKNPDA
jgi:demethylmenaquinone methyltransferase/2-methoxy-6-polyprenyl-1,4-benzoquinol methylase